MPNQPLVSIGLPTYNRASTLRRAIESALAQDYQNIELVISDNASTDETQAICQEVAARDQRVRYLRQQRNQGATVNFREVLKQSRGEFFMWLSDDDWMDDSYVSQCLSVLLAQPDLGLVCGREKYYENGEFVFESTRINLLQDTGAERVRAYYEQVSMNGTIYGLMRREQIAKVPFYEMLAGDWLFVARVAFQSKVKTLESVAINRSVAGESQNIHKLAASLGLSKFMVKNPHLKIALSLFGDIMRQSSPYRSMSLSERLGLGSQSAAAVIKRYCVPDWHRRLYERAKKVEAGLKHRFRSVQ
jgi:glycosyltransferase involved in cell wall biosynthesis